MIGESTTGREQNALQENAAHHHMSARLGQIHQRARFIQPSIQHVGGHLNFLQPHSGRIEHLHSHLEPSSVIHRDSDARCHTVIE